MPPQRFATTFARRPTRPRIGLTPGRRVWTTLSTTFLVVCLITGGTALAGRLSGSGSGDDAVAAVAEPTRTTSATPETKEPSPTATPSQTATEPEHTEDAAAEEADDEPTGAATTYAAEEPTTSSDGDQAESGGGERNEQDGSGGNSGSGSTKKDSSQQNVTFSTGQIVGLASKCAQAGSSNPQPGTSVVIHTCNSSSIQQWKVGSDGSLRNSGLCLSTKNRYTGDGTHVVLATCNSGDGMQDWRIERDAGDIVHVIADKCLDVANANTANGTYLQIAWCSGNSAQKWSAP